MVNGFYQSYTYGGGRDCHLRPRHVQQRPSHRQVHIERLKRQPRTPEPPGPVRSEHVRQFDAVYHEWRPGPARRRPRRV